MFVQIGDVRFCGELKANERCDISAFDLNAAEKARKFHETFKEYEPTPLIKIEDCGAKAIFVKDESKRFGLNAFKVLGGSYAIGSMLDKVPEDGVFITATDGNHGRGVAWTAEHFGKKSVVYMPKGTAKERLHNILVLGSDATILNMSYDDAVRKAKHDADENGWILIQDTAFENYEEVPLKIMQGYTTMALEAVEQMNGTVPTHVFLQAGVGSMAGAVTAFLADYYGARKPVITIVEPHSADCIFRTAHANDGTLHHVKGEMKTMMAGLACGEVCPTAWQILHSYANFFATIPDSFAADGMRMLSKHGIVSGESGAAAFSLAEKLLRNELYSPIREKLGLDSRSVVLCFSTEGNTDRENYCRIVGEKR